RRAEELACDAASPILTRQQRGGLEGDAPAGRSRGPGDEAAPRGLERAVVGGGGRTAHPRVDRGERGVPRGLDGGELPLAGGQRVEADGILFERIGDERPPALLGAGEGGAPDRLVGGDRLEDPTHEV